MPISFYTQAYNKKNANPRQGHTALDRAGLHRYKYEIGVYTIFFGRGPFLYPFPRKRLDHLHITRIHTSSYCLRMFPV